MSSNNISKNIEAYYDQYVTRQKNVGINKRHYSIIQKLINSGLRRNHSVLEIGCGIGTLTELLIKYLSKGKLLSLDISSHSIEEAKKRLGHYKNLSFLHADVVDYNFSNMKFDVVVLPDVIEHIPIEKHYELFKKISDVLEPHGFVFIHIPNPEYLEWCHIHRKELLQIVDQPIYSNILIENTLPHNLIIKKLETYSIGVIEGDYQYIVLQKKGYKDFTKGIKRTKIIDIIKYKLLLIFSR